MKVHDKNLFAVLDRLKERGLTVNHKCIFRVPELLFYGHKISGDGISPSEEKIAAVQNARAPETASEVGSFLGLVQYSAKFIADFAQVAEPLRMLTRQNEMFEWGKEQE